MENSPTRLSAVDRCLRRWPMLPLLSIGLWSGWQFVAFSGTLPLSAQNGNFVFYTTMVCVCLVAMMRPAAFRRFVQRPWSLIGAGGVCAGGTLLLLAPLFGSDPIPYAVLQDLNFAGQILCGLGITCVALYSCELLGRLNPSNIWIWLAYSEIFVTGLYFIVAGVGLIVAAAIFIALPLLAGYCLHLGDRPGSSLVLAQEEREQVDVAPSVYLKLAIFVLLLSLASSFARSIAVDPVSAATDQSLVSLAGARIVLAAAILAAIMITRKQFPFTQLCFFISAMVLLIFAFVSVGFPSGPLLFFMTSLAYGTLECITLAMAACLTFKTTRDPIFISGLFLMVLYGGHGLTFAVEAVSQAIGLPLPALFFPVVAIASIIFAFYFIQDRTYNILLGSIEDFDIDYQGHATEHPDAEDRALAVLRDCYELSPRECEVIEKLRGGSTVSRIADSMNLSVHTVRGYIHSIYAKCDVHSRNELLDLIEQKA